ncbi:hypothetical protein, partial [Nocardia abscessus]|uniref:hypothetical protein n=1 Tax=Nocardia abscessus TaxID=120957 RepID=UPI002456E443
MATTQAPWAGGKDPPAAAPGEPRGGATGALGHSGGAQRPERDAPLDYNGCANVTPNVTGLAERIDPAVRAVFTAHSHQPYV